MREYAKGNPLLRPDESTMNIILKVFSRSPSADAAAKAESFLSEMREMPHMKTTNVSYLTCIIAWGRSQSPDRLDRVQRLARQFLDETPGLGRHQGEQIISVLNAVLSVCHHTTDPKEKLEAWDLVMWVREEIDRRGNVSPDITTYEALMRATQVLEGPVDVLTQAVEACTKDGMISSQVLHSLYRASPEVFTQFFGKGLPDSVNVPRQWSKNVKGSRHRGPRNK